MILEYWPFSSFLHFVFVRKSQINVSSTIYYRENGIKTSKHVYANLKHYIHLLCLMQQNTQQFSLPLLLFVHFMRFQINNFRLMAKIQKLLCSFQTHRSFSSLFIVCSKQRESTMNFKYLMKHAHSYCFCRH